MKVTINGENFEYERKMPLADALAIEDECGRSYGEWESALAQGRAWAGAALAWLLWRRAGRSVPLADIMPGKDEKTGAALAPKVELDYAEMMGTVLAGVILEQREREEAEEAAKADPTPAAAAAPPGSDGTSKSTRRPSRSS